MVPAIALLNQSLTLNEARTEALKRSTKKAHFGHIGSERTAHFRHTSRGEPVGL